MDKSYQSPSLFSNSPANRAGARSSRPTANMLSKRAVGGGGGNSGNTSRMSVSGRSTTASQQIIARSSYNIAKSYGTTLPVLVTEALTFSERNADVSVGCSAAEFAWAVSGRRLLIWQFRESRSGSPQRRRGLASQCRELTLPHCDIGHRASLVTVFQTEGQPMASCLAVSPTGDARYWPSIAHDGSSVDESIGWEGQEFHELSPLAPAQLGYLLGTTTCHLVLLQIQLSGGRHQIQHRNLKTPAGFFGGIGKRFASIVGMQSQEKENRLVKVCSESGAGSKCLVSVLSEHYIQRWCFAAPGHESFLFQDQDLARKIKDRFHAVLWPSHDVSGTELWLLDMQQYQQGEVVVLAASLNFSHTPQVHYALITLTEAGDQFAVKQLHLLAYNAFYSKAEEATLLSMRFVLGRSYAYVFSGTAIYPVLINESPSEEVERLEFYSPGDRIMTGVINRHNLPLFFSRNHGHICVTSSDFEPELMNASMMSETQFSMRSMAVDATGSQTMLGSVQGVSSSATLQNVNLSMYELDPDEMQQQGSEAPDQLKAAFIFHLKGQVNSCASILRQLFPSDSLQPENDSTLDLTVYQIALDLAEDLPAADPRWEQHGSGDEMRRNALGSSTSLQIVQQLKEKSLAMTHFVEFLHATKLWERLTAITVRESIKQTCHLLLDINEKIVAAIALKCVHANYPKVMDMAIESVLEQRKEYPMGSLTAQDLFYVKVCRVQELFRVLGDMAENQVKEHATSSNNLILEINAIVLSALAEVFRFRESKRALYASCAQHRPPPTTVELLPWTSASGKSGIRDVLVQLIQVTLKHGVRGTGEPEVRHRFYQQMVELIDVVLDGKRQYLDSVAGTEKHAVLQRQYESQRSDLIYPLVDDEQYELAIKLAEKYLDFQTLVIVCDRTENQQKLDEYIARYAEHDFSQIAINWHLRQNKRADLFERFKHNQSALGQFLVDHPSLAWLQLIFNGEYGNAGKILLELATRESESVARKKTMLSLAKLAFCATQEHRESVERINTELNLIEYQVALRPELLQALGYETQNPRPLAAEEIIDVLVSEENEAGTEEDFRRALELLPYVEDALEARHKIWCSAILRDSWTTLDLKTPDKSLQELTFFKLVECCFLLDGQVRDLVPPAQTFLNAPELGNLATDKSFQFMLKYGYEQLERM